MHVRLNVPTAQHSIPATPPPAIVPARRLASFITSETDLVTLPRKKQLLMLLTTIQQQQHNLRLHLGPIAGSPGQCPPRRQDLQYQERLRSERTLPHMWTVGVGRGGLYPVDAAFLRVLCVPVYGMLPVPARYIRNRVAGWLNGILSYHNCPIFAPVCLPHAQYWRNTRMDKKTLWYW